MKNLYLEQLKKDRWLLLFHIKTLRYRHPVQLQKIFMDIAPSILTVQSFSEYGFSLRGWDGWMSSRHQLYISIIRKYIGAKQMLLFIRLYPGKCILWPHLTLQENRKCSFHSRHLQIYWGLNSQRRMVNRYWWKMSWFWHKKLFDGVEQKHDRIWFTLLKNYFAVWRMEDVRIETRRPA